MTDTTLPATSAAISAGAARLAIGAIVSYQILLFVLIFLRPDLDPSWHTISEWAIGPYGWIMSSAFLVSGMSYAALFVLLRGHLRGVVGRVGQVLLAVCTIGAIGVGLFTTDPMPIHPPLSRIGTMHVILGTSQLVLLPFAALLINLSLVRRNQMWTSARRALAWSAGLPLVGFASFALYSAIFVFPLGTGAYGPGVNIGWPPRFAFFTYMLWVVTVGWQAIRCNHRFSTPGGAQEDVAMPRGIVAKASISVHAPLAVVWDAFVNPAVIRRYMFGTNVVSDFKPGSPIAWKGEWNGKAYEDKGVILRFEPEQVLSYSHFSPMTGLPDKPENYHTVTIELSRRGEETLLSLSQDNNPTDEARAHSEENWTAMLKGIKALVEKQEPTGQSGRKW